MKQSKLILISILSGIFLLLCGVLIWGITGLNFGVNSRTERSSYIIFDDYIKVLEVEVPVERIEELNLLFDKNSNDIYFHQNDSEQILIEEYVNTMLSEKEETKVTETNGTLTLESPKRDTGIINVGINNRKGYVDVYLPKSYKGNMKIATLSGDIDTEMDFVLDEKAEFKASSTSGEILLLKVEAEKVDISSVSGNVDVETIIGETDISTVSGDVDVEAITGDTSVSTTSGEIEVSACMGDFNASTVSGDITINSVTGKTDFDTTSGYVRAEAMSGACNVSTVSGDIWLEYSQVNGDVDVSTTSGQVNINMPRDTTVEFEASTTSGDIDTFFDDYLSFNKKGNHASGTYGDGDANHVGISSISGDVRISPNQ